MLESIGHLHPIAIHFPLALLIAGFLFSLFGHLSRKEWIRVTFQAVGFWNFNIGIVSILPALLTGWAAYHTVAHDAPSHAAMTLHRNWALATSVLFFGLVLLAWRNRKNPWPSGKLAWSAVFIGLVLLCIAGFLGGRLVYRHGLGVQSLPAAEGEGHLHGSEGHSHGDAPENRKEPKAPMPDGSTIKPPLEPHHHDATPHKH